MNTHNFLATDNICYFISTDVFTYVLHNGMKPQITQYYHSAFSISNFKKSCHFTDLLRGKQYSNTV